MRPPMTRCTLLLLLAALALPSEAAAGAVSSQEAGFSPQDNEPAPPGSAADLALWRAGQAVGEQVVGERSRAIAMQARARGADLLGRLEAAAAKAGGKEGAELAALRERLLQSWSRNYQLLTRRWPVDPTRVCWAQRLAFDSQLRAQASPEPPMLAQARGELRECIDKGEAAARSMASANQELGEALEAAARALPVAAPAVPGAGR
jgi:hypothetical protein